MVEFAFDVNEVARGAFTSDRYQNLIGFEVALPVLERAFRETYGLELRDVFGDTDLAIGTYRHVVSTVIPDMTRLAWREKRDEILAATPNIAERDVVYTLTRQQYEATYGTHYRKPGFLARVVVMMFKVLPKFGPFKPLAFEPLTPESARLFADSFTAASARYRTAVSAAAAGRLAVRDLDLDTGEPPARGTNALADETYADLLDALADRAFASVPVALRRDIDAHYGSASPLKNLRRR